jgi:ABC-type bacteriocin/lantibiotic exporter with double-glycine peptidase domain
MYIFLFVMSLGRVYLMRISAQNITARLRSTFYASIMQREVAFFDKNKTGELISRYVIFTEQ